MNKYKLYTDGSHFKNIKGNNNGNIGRLGVGGLLVSNGGSIIRSMSKEIRLDWMSSNYGTSNVSNPTMEMLAVLLSLNEFKDDIAPGDQVEVYADYEGVRHWMYHKWKINKDYIYKIREDIIELVKSMRIDVSYFWVRGHNDDRYNEIADKLAKGEIKSI